MRPEAWTRTVLAGLLWGTIGVYVSLVGVVEAFARREIISGVVSLGWTLLLLSAIAPGFLVARGRAAGAGLARAAVAGGLWGAVMAAFVVITPAIHLREMFVNASPALLTVLTFGRGSGGLGLLVLAGAAGALAGAALALMSAAVRRPMLVGLVAVVSLGLFQDLIQVVLQSEAFTGVREFLYGLSGVSVSGAAVTFVLGAAATLVWPRRPPAGVGRFDHLPPGPRTAVRVLSVVLAGMLLLALPSVAGPFLSLVLVTIGLYTLMGLGLNLEIGFAGLLDLGFVAFFAIGAYTVGLLTSTGALGIAGWSFWAAVPIAVVVALIAGVIFGVPVLRIRGDYLAIATLGFGEIIRLLVLSDFLRPWLGGSQGVLEIPRPVLSYPCFADGRFAWCLAEFNGPEQIYFLSLVASALIAFVAMRLRDSRLGRAWMALREDEDVAEAMGINLVNIKLLAYGIGAAFAGLAGAIFAIQLGSIFPHSFSLLISINVLALIIVGGMGSLPGVVVGSLVLVGLPELLREFNEYRFLIYGALLVAMMQWRPEGLWPAAAQRRELHEAEPLAVTEEPERELATAESEVR